MIVSLEEIAELSREKSEENKRFSKFLRTLPNKVVDDQTAKLSSEISAQVDCTQCGNCCRSLHPPVVGEEITTLAKSCNMEASAFTEKYLATDHAGITYIKTKACAFFSGKRCSHYASRPSSCADYPHLQQPYIRLRMKSILENYAICPIVFNVIEALKEETGFSNN